jgi:hypothetical protein
VAVNRGFFATVLGRMHVCLAFGNEGREALPGTGYLEKGREGENLGRFHGSRCFYMQGADATIV